ncbi:SDR family NAD(P)-dependent oxidoreductase [Pantoea sp. EA-12]|uniref:SDR family NAD(P)-dependent oxidoreductase n=1 Tax=Pantoea sp. EA-12 TaxID=3043303 RepID=UPI0024B49C0B|nr:SDR family NAD(P)-dependent oxidoreductase [Pantoea sp. EA-12]MDI9224014.1 SDR family NAD(P)-dependent oxidoreductase [Pantoea sp. EA-12]
MKLSFAGKRVVISGGAIGFGREMAQQFYALGADVYVCDIQAAAMADLADTGIKTAVVDLLDRQAANAWIADITASAAIDVLINNAGGVAGQQGKALEEVSDVEWDKVVEINLGAAFALSRAVAPSMKRHQQGRIINICSGAALKASLTGVQAYCAAKHAVLGLTRQLAHELGPYGIQVNAIAPGFVFTNEATQQQWNNFGPERQQQVLNNIALRRLGTVQDIAHAALFLASDLASFINGQIISVDGGS